MAVRFEDLHVGDYAEYGKTITEADILLFAAVSGDNNPIHINQEYAEHTPFHGRIAHGMLTASLISTCLGTRLPGEGAIYLSQSTRFLAPVHIGDTVVARVTVAELLPGKHKVRFTTECRVRGELVMDGESLVLIPHPETDALSLTPSAPAQQ